MGEHTRNRIKAIKANKASHPSHQQELPRISTMLKSPYDLRPKRGGDDPEDKKGKMPKKTCGDGSKPTTTKYGAPTGNQKFQIGSVIRLAFNSNQKSFGFEFTESVSIIW